MAWMCVAASCLPVGGVCFGFCRLWHDVRIARCDMSNLQCWSPQASLCVPCLERGNLEHVMQHSPPPAANLGSLFGCTRRSYFDSAVSTLTDQRFVRLLQWGLQDTSSHELRRSVSSSGRWSNPHRTPSSSSSACLTTAQVAAGAPAGFRRTSPSVAPATQFWERGAWRSKVLRTGFATVVIIQ